MQEEILIPRTWHGNHLQGIPGYEIIIGDHLTISIGIQSNGIVSVIIVGVDAEGNVSSEVRYWAKSVDEALQWIANQMNFPVQIDENEAVYPTEYFDDGDDEEMEEEFDDGDDGDDEEVHDDDAESESDTENDDSLDKKHKEKE